VTPGPETIRPLTPLRAPRDDDAAEILRRPETTTFPCEPPMLSAVIDRDDL
jgi:hypothetical protein